MGVGFQTGTEMGINLEIIGNVTGNRNYLTEVGEGMGVQTALRLASSKACCCRNVLARC